MSTFGYDILTDSFMFYFSARIYEFSILMKYWLTFWLLVFFTLVFWTQVNSILRHVGEILGYTSNSQLEELYSKTAWFFDQKYNSVGFGAYEAFKTCVK